MNRPALKEWFRTHLLEEILPRWLEAAVCPNGFFHPSLDREWRRTGPAEATVVSQSRLLYNFSAGWRHTEDEDYWNAVSAGATFLIEHFHEPDPDYAAWFFAVGPDGAVVDDRKDAYGQAFLIFGLAQVALALEDMTAYDYADQALLVVQVYFEDKHGGLVPVLGRDMQDLGGIRSQNPIMHLFEATLALWQSEGRWSRKGEFLQKLAEFVFHSLGDARTGRLPEVYDDEWQELPREQGGRIDIGHAMEWAFLLSRGVELGLSDEWLAVAERLLERGLEVGEAPDGGLYSNEAPEGGLLSKDKSWWQQCELIRALIHFATVRGREDLWPKIERHLAYVQESFIDPEYGGWYATPAIDGKPPENAAKGSAWKVGYHVVAMCEEALRVL